MIPWRTMLDLLIIVGLTYLISYVILFARNFYETNKAVFFPKDIKK
jgi:hypothetical protein